MKSARWLITIKVLIAAVLIGGVIFFSDYEKVVTNLRQASPIYVLLGVAVFMTGQIIASLRWWYVLLSKDVHINAYMAYKLHMIGVFASNFMPGQGAGDLLKASLLFKSYQSKKAFLMASILFDRLSGLVAVLVLALFSMSFFGLEIFDKFGGQSVSVLVFVLITLVLLAQADIVRRSVKEIVTKLGKRFLNFSSALVSLVSDVNLAIKSISLSLLFQLTWSYCLYCMLLSLQGHVPIWHVVFASTMSTLLATIPISFGGLGIREGVFAVILGQLGVEYDLAATAALLSVLPLLFSSLLGACFLSFTHDNYTIKESL